MIFNTHVILLATLFEAELMNKYATVETKHVAGYAELQQQQFLQKKNTA